MSAVNLPRGSAVLDRNPCKHCPPGTVHNVRGVIDFPDSGRHVFHLTLVKFDAEDLPPCWTLPVGGTMWRDTRHLTPIDAVTLLGELA